MYLRLINTIFPCLEGDYLGGSAAIVGALLAVKSLIGTLLIVRLTTTSGAVFGSQVGYVMAFAGIVWSRLPPGESPAPAT